MGRLILLGRIGCRCLVARSVLLQGVFSKYGFDLALTLSPSSLTSREPSKYFVL